jgi:hypothetical protein
VTSPPKAEDVTITHMTGTASASAKSAPSAPIVQTAGTTPVPTQSGGPANNNPTPPAKPAFVRDTSMSLLPPSLPPEQAAPRVASLPEPAPPTASATPTHLPAPQTTTDLKPVSGTSSSGGPSLDLPPEPLPAKPRELKPDLDQLAAQQPLPAPPPSKTASSPVVRLVNKKRITLNYEVKDVGPSGVSGVELWYTRDGKDWKRHEAALESKPPYLIEVQEEGLYGFTLLAKNGIGLSKDPPRSGDQPQVWVEVDLTKPAIQITQVKVGQGDKGATLTIAWKASDKNLSSQPITLSIAEKEDGPWQPIVSNLENFGRCVWPLRPGVPAKLFVRIEAKDLAGNVGVAQTPTAIQVDVARPTVHILDVEPSGS